MRTLVIGASGQVGAELATRDAFGELVVTTRDGKRDGVAGPVHALDVTDLDATAQLIRDVAPDVVINASAYTAVDRAEAERDLAFRVNADAPGAMAEACAGVGARFVHYSTDYVFDGCATTPYREDAPTSPLGVYGESKRAGEIAVLASGTDALILRTAWVYAMHGNNFLRTMLRVAAERDVLRVVDDQLGSPTPAWMIADATAHLLQAGSPISGVVHVVANGMTSWHGFADAIISEAFTTGRLRKKPRIEPIATADYPTPAKRPAYSVLDTSRLQAAGFVPPDWRSGLARTFKGACAA